MNNHLCDFIVKFECSSFKLKRAYCTRQALKNAKKIAKRKGWLNIKIKQIDDHCFYTDDSFMLAFELYGKKKHT